MVATWHGGASGRMGPGWDGIEGASLHRPDAASSFVGSRPSGFGMLEDCGGPNGPLGGIGGSRAMRAPARGDRDLFTVLPASQRTGLEAPGSDDAFVPVAVAVGSIVADAGNMPQLAPRRAGGGVLARRLDAIRSEP